MERIPIKRIPRPNLCEFVVQSNLALIEKIIPFFNKQNILGIKQKDFNDWCKVADLIKNKSHLTKEGLDMIKQIKAGMNKGRVFE